MGEGIGPLERKQTEEVLRSELPQQALDRAGRLARLRIERVVVEGHQVRHAADRVVVEAQTGQNRLRQVGADLAVAVKVSGSVPIHRKAGGLAAVMQEGGQAKDRVRTDGLGGDGAVGQHVVAMVFAPLVEARHRGQLRHRHGEDGPEAADHPPHVRAADQLDQLHGDPFAADCFQQILFCKGRGCGGRVEIEAEDGGKSQGAKDAQSILVKAAVGVSDAADALSREIVLPAAGVHESGLRAPGHCVDGEIPAGEVVLDLRGKADLVRVAVVRVGAVCAEGRDLHRMPVQQKGDGPVLETGLDDALARKDGLGLLRPGGGRNVVIPRHTPHQRIAHAAADQEGGISARTKPGNGVQRIGWNVHGTPPWGELRSEK